MFQYLMRRLALLIPVLLGMTFVVFLIIYNIPGDPATAILGERASEEALHELRAKMGLDQPWFIQYGIYLKQLLTGDLGISYRTKVPIVEEILPYFAATLELTLVAMFIALLFGLNAGIISAWKKDSWFDHISMLVALIGISMPIFWLGLMEQWFFAQKMQWLPAVGRENPAHPIQPITHLYLLDTLIQGEWSQFKLVLSQLILPGFALATIPMALIARISRSSMLEVMNQDYIRTARAKGVRSFWVVYRHGLKNGFIPILTIIGLQMGFLLGGAVLTETIFAWPGVGRYIYDAIQFRDYPVVQSGILLIAFTFVMINLVVDLLYQLFDPRIQYK